MEFTCNSAVHSSMGKSPLAIVCRRIFEEVMDFVRLLNSMKKSVVVEHVEVIEQVKKI